MSFNQIFLLIVAILLFEIVDFSFFALVFSLILCVPVPIFCHALVFLLTY